MGCDIHIFAEKKNPKTQDWEQIGKKFLYSYALYQIEQNIVSIMGVDSTVSREIVGKFLNGESPENKLENVIINHYLPRKVMMGEEGLDVWDAMEVGKLPDPYCIEPYQGQNYQLFSVLAGVRGGCTSRKDQISEIKGIPDDTNDFIKKEYNFWGDNAHSASYYYLDELLNCKYRKMGVETLRSLNIDSWFFHEMLDKSVTLIDDPKDLRFVFWFDS